jgi:transcriptional regulator with PAS, ATPase and Fis domain
LIGRRSSSQPRKVGLYPRFLEDASFWLDEELLGSDLALAPDLVFSWFFQLRRAWHFIFRTIVGGSRPAARVRAAVWESVFTHDMRRYRRSLYASMGDLTTLVTGPSGTGKELVARAIGLSRFIPFDPIQQVFKEDYEGAFFALNISALTPTLVESELFGHQRGAFTGAVKDRIGWLEVCPPLGAVFLDEIGEVDESIQVKLLRVLQTRRFQRLGDTQDRQFHGKLIAATNREPQVEMAQGRLREDFYYRLCSDLVRTASLRDQLDEAPDARSELSDLVKNIAVRLVGDDEAEILVEQVVSFVIGKLGLDYPWSGNFRELEQCVRNVLIRGEYRPASSPGKAGRDHFVEQVTRGDLDLETLTSRYVTLVYQRAGSYVEAGRRLGMDRRTVKARVDEKFLSEL